MKRIAQQESIPVALNLDVSDYSYGGSVDQPLHRSQSNKHYKWVVEDVKTRKRMTNIYYTQLLHKVLRLGLWNCSLALLNIHRKITPSAILQYKM